MSQIDFFLSPIGDHKKETFGEKMKSSLASAVGEIRK